MKAELEKNVPLQGLFFDSEYDSCRQNGRKLRKGDFVIIKGELAPGGESARYSVSFCAENTPLFMRAFLNENGKTQKLNAVEEIEIVGTSFSKVQDFLMLVSSLSGLSMKFLKDTPSGMIYELV